MSGNEGKMNRRDFFKGAAMGVMGGMLATMGIYSYSPWRKAHFQEAKRKLVDIGVCKSLKVTNISETSWFTNADLMSDIKGAGGLLVNQYDYNWPPFGDGSGLGKGSYEKGIAKIKHLLPDRVDEAWDISEKLSVHPENAGGYACLIELEEVDGKVHKYLLDTGWSYKWTDECFKREGIDQMLRNREIEALFISHEHFDHFWGMGMTKMGQEYGFSSWSLHMTFIIIFSNVWGLYFKEWRGTSRGTRTLVWIGLAVLILSTIIIGYANRIGAN